MLVQVNYLGNHHSVDIGPLMSALCAEVSRRAVDPEQVLVTLDWVQYRKNFRSPVAARRYLGGDGETLPQIELAVDVRRVADGPESVLASALDHAEGVGLDDGRIYLEPSRPPSQSVIWAFNAAYWRNLSTWEGVFKRDFLAALPGGVTDGANVAFWRDQLTELLTVLDDLKRRGLLPEEIYVVELGVGSGTQAKAWLDTFRDLCAERGQDYYQRVRYLMTDYSHDVLRMARNTVAEHVDKISTLNVDVVNLQDALAFLRYKVLFIHSSNLYDNLPSDEIARRDGTLYEVRARAHLRADAVEALCVRYDLQPAEIGTTIERLLRIGPEYFDDVERGVRFWADAWDAIRLEEVYVRIDQPGQHRIASGVHGVWLEDLLDGVSGDLRMHLSTDALRSFANTLPLLHPNGIFQVQDLFATRLEQFRGSFRGPGKMDGSVVNWLNGPLFQAVGAHLGYDVHLEHFRYREKSNIVVLSTSQRA